MFTELDIKHEELGSGLASMAQKIDAFFGDDRAYEDANKSQAQITLDTTKKEDNNVQFDLRARAKVLLPRTQKKLRLLIDSDAPELGQDPNVSNSLATTVQGTSFSLALETLLPVLQEWNVAPALGIKADWPPDLYARIRATRYFDIQPWLSRFSTKASWYAIAGPIITVAIDFDRPLNPDWLFRAASSLKWADDNDTGENTNASESFIFYQKLSYNRSASYSVSANTDSDSNWAIQSYVVGVAYRQVVYKDWMFGEINPFVEYTRENNWNDRAGITLRIEALFGG